MDLFLAGRTARVEGIHRDVEDAAYVAVALEDDPASDLHSWHGRFYYFYPEEVEPLEAGAGEGPDAERRSHETRGTEHAGADHGPDPAADVAGAGPLYADQADVGSRRILIAGVGNIFLGDDGFGVEVANRLSSMALPEHVRVADFGIRGVHLAYELLERGYETTILVDAVPRGGEPGTVYLIEPDLDRLGDEGPGLADAHGMDPRAVFALLKTLGGTPGRVLIVGCEPARTEEEMGLSAPAAAAVDEAIGMILGLLEREEPAAYTPGNRSKEENP
jgi:hydrogenase maturation protease